MTGDNYPWGLSNPGPDALLVWLEPWAEEFEVPAGSTIAMKPCGSFQESALGEVEWGEDHLIVWANAQTVEVFLDGALQDTGSASIPIPDGLTKDMLGILFGDQPAARLGGQVSPERPSWWRRMRNRLGV